MKEKKNLKLRNYLILLLGQTISQLGTSMTSFALVIWAYTQNRQVLASSLLAVCSAVPYLLVSLFGGAVADNMNKKKIMLICDTIAAGGTLMILCFFQMGCLSLWILCAINIINGFMNAFQNPASQVAVTLLIEKDDYVRVGGIQSVVSSLAGMLTPILAAALLSFGGLGLILVIDLFTFLFAFLTLLLMVKIPDIAAEKESTSFSAIIRSVREGISFVKEERGIRYILVMYCVLEFMGAISFDSMYSPLLLARTQNNEMVVGIVSAFMAVGCLTASVMMSVMKSPGNKMKMMYAGSYLCLAGIALFGMGRNIWQWCIIVFIGCFGSPVYSTYQTAILREKVEIGMQGRVFSLQGMITQMLSPIGYILGAVTVDHLLEPLMARSGKIQDVLAIFVGSGTGAGIGLIFVAAGLLGIVLLTIFKGNDVLRTM